MIKPIGDRVLVERVPDPEKTNGGIVIPGTAADNESRAVKYFVLAIGPGRRVNRVFVSRPEVKPRDFIYASCYAGKEIHQGNRKMRLIEWADVLAQVIE